MTRCGIKYDRVQDITQLSWQTDHGAHTEQEAGAPQRKFDLQWIEECGSQGDPS